MPNTLRALVVDDDPIARKTVMFALEQEGFRCDMAVDGEDALRHLSDNNAYDLVVTDLLMPNIHGHALSVELLAQQPRPIVIVHSSVDDPRLTKDLMSRGIDDIVYKPTNYAAFAAKVKGLVSHRHGLLTDTAPAEHTPSSAGAETTAVASAGKEERASEPEPDTSNCLLVPISDIENKISLVSRILPVSKTALDVFEITRSECDASKLGAAIQRDAALAAEVLSIANSSFYNPSRNPITDLDKAVVRIGQQRIGELAVAAATLSALTERKLPWMDMQIIWRQSIAAGVAVEHLVAQGGHGKSASSLALIAIMNSLGRVVLGTLYPTYYRQLVKKCAERDEALVEQEKQVFPENHARIMTRLLSVWNIPDELCKPLNYLLDSYGSLVRLSDPTRTSVELVKLAVFIGQLATQAWHSWDLVEIPPASLLQRLQIHDVRQILEETRNDAQVIMDFKSRGGSESQESKRSGSKSARMIWYENLSALPFDFAAQLVQGLDIRIENGRSDDVAGEAKVLINCFGASDATVPTACPMSTGALIITDHEYTPNVGVPCEILRMPVSYGRFRSAVLGVAVQDTQVNRTSASAGTCDIRV